MFKIKAMYISAGICFIYNNKILFCHPTNASWKGTFSPPKGGVDEGETYLEAAIREAKEEVGIEVSLNQIENIDNPLEVIYYKRKNKDAIHKIVYLFIVRVNNLSEIGLESEIAPKEQLQIEEVDWAEFLNKEEIADKAFHRFQRLKDLLI